MARAQALFDEVFGLVNIKKATQTLKPKTRSLPVCEKP
ncbi:hypothetical protein ADICYQ_0833 [Cyclobacterium qasimii M12-11B]|uniref:Uncharacterized protein n=1 Tax=Cyclobacterium qasimii M12-11B TaxID=641524 RepID=S7VN91_9BACT|nr:hypothetical protein ADICYQ_0833 [Cyclobacterium qasimii M12-11B]